MFLREDSLKWYFASLLLVSSFPTHRHYVKVAHVALILNDCNACMIQLGIYLFYEVFDEVLCALSLDGKYLLLPFGSCPASLQYQHVFEYYRGVFLCQWYSSILATLFAFDFWWLFLPQFDIMEPEYWLIVIWPVYPHLHFLPHQHWQGTSWLSVICGL